MKRRTFLKAVAGTSAVAAVGGTSFHSDRLQLIGRSQALAPLAGLAVGLGVAGAAGFAGWELHDNLGGGADYELDPDDVVEDKIWSVGDAIAKARTGTKGARSNVQDRFITPTVGNTDFADSTWSQIRADSIAAISAGEGESGALQAANEALDRQGTRSATGFVESWNNAILTMLPQMVRDYEESVGAINGYGDLATVSKSVVDNHSYNLSVVPESEIQSGDYMAVWVQVPDSDLPHPISDTDREEPLKIAAPVFDPTQPSAAAPFFGGDDAWFNLSHTDGDLWLAVANSQWTVTHPDLATRTWLDPAMYHDALTAVQDGYSNIQGNLDTYVSDLAQGLHEGTVEVTEILGPQDIADNYATNDKQTRFAQEMFATGIGLPEDMGFKAKVSHPDLQSSSKWGDLYVDLVNDSLSINKPMTVPSADYNFAMVGFDSEATGEFTPVRLSGSSDLEILEVDTSNSERFNPDDKSAQDDSSVVVSEQDPPGGLDKDSIKISEWAATLKTSTGNTHTVQYTDLTKQDGKLIAETTPFDPGAVIEEVHWFPSVTYDQPTEAPADPTNIDPEQQKQQIQYYREQYAKLEEVFEDAESGNVAFDFGSGLPTLPGLNFVQSVLVTGGGILGLSFLTR